MVDNAYVFAALFAAGFGLVFCGCHCVKSHKCFGWGCRVDLHSEFLLWLPTPGLLISCIVPEMILIP